MIKTGDVKEAVTRCDVCGEMAIEIDDRGHAYCPKHCPKEDESSPAGEDCDWHLKSIADRLAARQMDGKHV